MNHCLLEVKVKQTPTIRYTQDNQTAVAEMEVSFEGLRPDDKEGSLKVIGWGNLAQELQNNVQIGQRLILEGRLRMNTVPRQDGTKEKKAEFTLSKYHSVSKSTNQDIQSSVSPQKSNNAPIEQHSKNTSKESNSSEDVVNWDSSPLIPDTDEIPF